MGGRSAQSGFYLQNLIAVRDALGRDDWTYMILEPEGPGFDKVDYMQQLKDGSRRCVQVKSTTRHFTVREVKKWTKELLRATPDAQQRELMLVGTTSDVAEACTTKDVKVVHLPQDPEIIWEGICLRLDGLLEGDSTSRLSLKMLGSRIMQSFTESAIRASPIGRDTLLQLLQTSMDAIAANDQMEDVSLPRELCDMYLRPLQWTRRQVDGRFLLGSVICGVPSALAFAALPVTALLLGGGRTAPIRQTAEGGLSAFLLGLFAGAAFGAVVNGPRYKRGGQPSVLCRGALAGALPGAVAAGISRALVSVHGPVISGVDAAMIGAISGIAFSITLRTISSCGWSIAGAGVVGAASGLNVGVISLGVTPAFETAALVGTLYGLAVTVGLYTGSRAAFALLGGGAGAIAVGASTGSGVPGILFAACFFAMYLRLMDYVLIGAALPVGLAIACFRPDLRARVLRFGILDWYPGFPYCVPGLGMCVRTMLREKMWPDIRRFALSGQPQASAVRRILLRRIATIVNDTRTTEQLRKLRENVAWWQEIVVLLEHADCETVRYICELANMAAEGSSAGASGFRRFAPETKSEELRVAVLSLEERVIPKKAGAA